MASGIVVALIVTFIRRFFRADERTFPLKFNAKTFGLIAFGIVVIAMAGTIIALAVKGAEIPSVLYTVFFIAGLWLYFIIT